MSKWGYHLLTRTGHLELSVELSVSGYYTKSQVIILFEHNDE